MDASSDLISEVWKDRFMETPFYSMHQLVYDATNAEDTGFPPARE
jgi:hypothetical protein